MVVPASRPFVATLKRRPAAAWRRSVIPAICRQGADSGGWFSTIKLAPPPLFYGCWFLLRYEKLPAICLVEKSRLVSIRFFVPPRPGTTPAKPRAGTILIVMSNFGPAPSTLLESEERFRLLVDSVKDYAIFMLDPNGIVSTWNAGAERIKGYTADEIIGRHFSTFYLPADK